MTKPGQALSNLKYSFITASLPFYQMVPTPDLLFNNNKRHIIEKFRRNSSHTSKITFHARISFKYWEHVTLAESNLGYHETKRKKIYRSKFLARFRGKRATSISVPKKTGENQAENVKEIPGKSFSVFLCTDFCYNHCYSGIFAEYINIYLVGVGNVGIYSINMKLFSSTFPLIVLAISDTILYPAT